MFAFPAFTYRPGRGSPCLLGGPADISPLQTTQRLRVRRLLLTRSPNKLREPISGSSSVRYMGWSLHIL